MASRVTTATATAARLVCGRLSPKRQSVVAKVRGRDPSAALRLTPNTSAIWLAMISSAAPVM